MKADLKLAVVIVTTSILMFFIGTFFGIEFNKLDHSESTNSCELR